MRFLYVNIKFTQKRPVKSRNRQTGVLEPKLRNARQNHDENNNENKEKHEGAKPLVQRRLVLIPPDGFAPSLPQALSLVEQIRKEPRNQDEKGKQKIAQKYHHFSFLPLESRIVIILTYFPFFFKCKCKKIGKKSCDFGGNMLKFLYKTPKKGEKHLDFLSKRLGHAFGRGISKGVLSALAADSEE